MRNSGSNFVKERLIEGPHCGVCGFTFLCGYLRAFSMRFLPSSSFDYRATNTTNRKGRFKFTDLFDFIKLVAGGVVAPRLGMANKNLLICCIFHLQAISVA